ncbi:MAG: hypothetical protein HQL76_13830 [Magnetococcales bacterium]|nr:hypothetical protein [Magnetococcales bacterium]
MMELDYLKSIMDLIRDNRFDDAWDVIDHVLQTEPERVAQWYLLSRFIACGDQPFSREVRGSLGEISRAALRAFDGILEGLEAYVPEAVAIENARNATMTRLEKFLATIREVGHCKETGTKELRYREEEPLLRFLERMRLEKLARMDPAKRIELRLDGLRRRMKIQSDALPEVGRHRLADRLIAFGGTLREEGKKGVRHV